MRDSGAGPSGRLPMPGGRRTRLAITGIFGIVGLLAAACSGSPTAAKGQHGSGTGANTAASGAAQVSITPANGSASVKPNRGVTVTVAHGKLRNVQVVTGSDPATGTLSQNGTVWHSLWPLHVNTDYSVTATAVGVNGKTVTATSSFGTLRPSRTVVASTVLGHQAYGVGIPIMIAFSHTVARRYQASVERAIEIKSSKPVVGAWEWDNECGQPECLNFRTREYWPQHTKVSFDAHFNGIEVAPGVYGVANLTQSFTIGYSLIGVTSTVTHHTNIYWKGKFYQTWPDSTGRPGLDTVDGTYLTIEKANPVLMTGPGYTNLPVYWSVRFTWSGDYYHSAPWSVGEQGFVNVSHGCVNLPPADAQWYYVRSDPGDPITVTGSPAAGSWDDGWTEWFLSWKQLVKRSATRQAVEVGPNGSTFVNPDTLPAKVPDSIFHGSKPGNYLPGANV